MSSKYKGTEFILYYKSPKKLRELKEIHDLLKESFKFPDKGCKPLHACGTRWLAHEIGALLKYLDKFAIFIFHIKNITEDYSYAFKDGAKFFGYLKKWYTTKMIVKVTFYFDILELTFIIASLKSIL